MHCDADKLCHDRISPLSAAIRLINSVESPEESRQLPE
jgi:hypothetical protein